MNGSDLASLRRKARVAAQERDLLGRFRQECPFAEAGQCACALAGRYCQNGLAMAPPSPR